MKFLTIFGACIFAATTLSNGQNETETIPEMEPKAIPKCQGIDMKMAEDKLMGIRECLKEVDAECFKDVPTEKMPCVATCVLQKRELMDDKGMIQKDNLEQAIGVELPEDIKKELVSKMGSCIDQHGMKFDNVDPTCVSGELVDCIRMAYMEVCTM